MRILNYKALQTKSRESLGIVGVTEEAKEAKEAKADRRACLLATEDFYHYVLNLSLSKTAFPLVQAGKENQENQEANQDAMKEKEEKEGEIARE